MNTKTVVLVVVVIAVLLTAGFLYRSKTANDDRATQELSNALKEAVVETPVVAPSVNPIKKVLPTANPIEKTNPFKNEYKNPFE